MLECIRNIRDAAASTKSYFELNISARTRTSITSLLFSHRQFSSALVSWYSSGTDWEQHLAFLVAKTTLE